MAVTRFDKDMAKISKLPNQPYNDKTMTPEKLKAAFDEAGTELKAYVNETLCPEIDTLIGADQAITDEAEASATAAAGSASTAATKATEANASAILASASEATATTKAGEANASAISAVAAKDAIENMTASVSGLDAGAPPTVTKTTVEDIVNLAFAIPKGDTGAQGIQGVQGLQGVQGIQGIQGATGKGITSIIRTSGTGEQGTTDTYTITYSDSTTTTFNVVNGADGVATTQEIYDIVKGRQILTPPSQTILRNHTKPFTGYSSITQPNNASGVVETILSGMTLKNELNYNNVTWAEWQKTAGVTADASGMLYSSDGVTAHNAYINTQLKAATKYGVLINIVSSTVTSGVRIPNNQAFAMGINLPSIVGNQKGIDTTYASILAQRVSIRPLLAEAVGNNIKIKDIRLFELPTGSQIETDFTNLTADVLALKYPYIKGDGTKSVEALRVKSTDGTNTSYMYANTTLRAVPSIADTVDSNGVKTQNVSEAVTLDGSLNWGAINVTATNTYRTIIADWCVGKNVLQSTDYSGNAKSSDGDYPVLKNAAATDVRNINFGYTTSTNTLYLRVEKTKVDAQAGATTSNKLKAYLNLYPITLNYQLALPVTTNIPVYHFLNGKLTQESPKAMANGTQSTEPCLSGLLTSATQTITDSTKPIKSIRKVYEIEVISGRLTTTDVTANASTAGNLALTLSGFDSTKTYFYDCEYDTQYSTNPLITANIEVIGGVVAKDYGAAATAWTLTANESKAKYFSLTNAGGSANMIMMPQDGETKIIKNASGQTITVKTATSTGITIANAKTATVLYMGTDYIKIGEV